MSKVIKKYISNYEIYKALVAIKYNFWQINWAKTIWFNCKALPIKQAVHLPFVIAYNVKIKSIGKIIINGIVHPGMVSLGVIKINSWESNSDKLFFSNYGILEINGRMKIHPGAKVVISPKAKITCGARTSIGCMTKVICRCGIEIGNDFQISWDGQIFDTDFHFLQNTLTDKIYNRNKTVKIGDNVFIGNSCTIGKGTILPTGSVVSCCSKVSGDYSGEGENLLISGNPAKIIKKGVQMGNGWFPEKEKEIALLLGE